MGALGRGGGGAGSRFPACCIKLHLHSEGVGETAWMCRLIRTFAVRLEDKYSEHIDCLKTKTFEGQLSHLVVHAREKRYSCGICRQSFHFTYESTVVSDLTRFKRGKPFVRSSGLRKHMFTSPPTRKTSHVSVM